jgi:hypothetical protein
LGAAGGEQALNMPLSACRAAAGRLPGTRQRPVADGSSSSRQRAYLAVWSGDRGPGASRERSGRVRKSRQNRFPARLRGRSERTAGRLGRGGPRRWPGPGDRHRRRRRACLAGT